mmetsp:Transcript_127023/g.290642  ORF Transcript_127023/g.290642 Transcript_127023/m.290642 type:complete len:324 (-) Transcript_127023:49-1020(-)
MLDQSLICKLGVVLGAQAGSFAACLWFACRFRGQPDHVKRRILPRQLFSLAVALLLSESGGFLYVGYALIDQGSPEQARSFCYLWYLVYSTFQKAVCLQFVHIALVFLSQAARWLRALELLDNGIAVVWAGGALLGIPGAIIYPMVPHDSTHICVSERFDIVSLSVVSLSFVLCLAAYVGAVLQARASAPLSVQQRQWKRAAVFPLIQILCIGSFLATEIQAQMSFNWLWALGLAGYSSIGVLTVAAYAFQSRSPLSTARTPSKATSCVYPGSFTVGFGEEELLVVSAINAEAQSRAEREIELRHSARELTGVWGASPAILRR